MLKNIMKPTIDKETAEYRNQEDIINRFIDEYCIYSPNSTICLSELMSHPGAFVNSLSTP